MEKNINKQKKINNVFKILFMSSIIGLSVIFVLLLLFSFAIWKTNISQIIIDILLVFILCIGTATAGFLAALKIKEKGYLYGLIESIIIITILTLVGIGYKNNLPLWFLLTKILLPIVSGIVGGIFALNRKQKHIKY